MSFSSFSKDFAENAFTSVENRFIEKYLPEAEGDAVRVYLYGLYLCGSGKDLDGEHAAQLLGIPYARLAEYFDFWEECGLVQVLSRSPLYVEYLPVSAAVGKPKPMRPEKYAEFNRELFALLQRAGKDLKPYEQQRILEFLENGPMQQQAFLLVVAYYANREGAKLSVTHILNAANKLVREHKYTYEQVESEYADFHRHEAELLKLFPLLGIYRKPQDSDYALLAKWQEAGVEAGAVFACAEALKKGTMATLDQLVGELIAKGVASEQAAKAYLARRAKRAELVFAVARKLGVKVQNPRPYVEEYAEKWEKLGFSEGSVLALSALGLHLGYDFAALDTCIAALAAGGCTEEEKVKAYCEGREKLLKLLGRIQAACGVVKQSEATLNMVATWKAWGFSDAMILEAAKRSFGAASPLPYMNKLLSEWQRGGVTTIDAIPEDGKPQRREFRSETAVAADARSDRERYYAALREKAQRRVDRALSIAEKDEEFRTASAALSKGELELAKAEVYHPEQLSEISSRVEEARKKRAEALSRLKLSERDFVPKFTCRKCSDTGYLPDGRMCDCYPG